MPPNDSRNIDEGLTCLQDGCTNYSVSVASEISDQPMSQASLASPNGSHKRRHHLSFMSAWERFLFSFFLSFFFLCCLDSIIALHFGLVKGLMVVERGRGKGS